MIEALLLQERDKVTIIAHFDEPTGYAIPFGSNQPEKVYAVTIVLKRDPMFLIYPKENFVIWTAYPSKW